MKSIVTLALLALLSSASPGQTSGSATVIKDGYGSAYFLRFSPDGRELARVCLFGPAMLFDTRSFNKARTFPVGLRMVAYNPDGTRITTAEGTDGARVWDSALQGKPIPKLNRLPNGKPIPNELVVNVRELDSPLQVLQAPSRDSRVRVFWTEFSPDGKLLITTHANGHVKVWNTRSWTLEDDLPLTDREVRAAAFAPDSNSFVIGDIDGVLHQWSLVSIAKVITTRTPLGAVTGVAFTPDSKTLVTIHQSASGRGVMIWNTDTWIAVTRHGFGSAALSKDGTILALGGNNIELIDPVSQRQIRTIELPQMTFRESQPLWSATGQLEKQPNADTKIPISVDALAFSPDGGTLAAGCIDGTVRLVKMTQ